MQEVLDFLLQNGAELLLSIMALFKIVVRLTPTKKDDKVFGYLDDLVSFFITNNEKRIKKK